MDNNFKKAKGDQLVARSAVREQKPARVTMCLSLVSFLSYLTCVGKAELVDLHDRAELKGVWSAMHLLVGTCRDYDIGDAAERVVHGNASNHTPFTVSPLSVKEWKW